MDFVVSKVVMSICALMVVTVLGGMFSSDSLFDGPGELESVLRNLCSTADALAFSNGKSIVGWRVPFTSSGGNIRIAIEESIIRAESGSEKAADQPACQIRTWSYDGRMLNSSQLSNLDSTSNRVVADSGNIILLSSDFVLVDNERLLLVFADLAS